MDGPSGIIKRPRKSRSGSTQSRATHSSRDVMGADVMEADDIGRTSGSRPNDMPDHGARVFKCKLSNKPSISLFPKQRQLLVCGRARAFLLTIPWKSRLTAKIYPFKLKISSATLSRS